jgi:malonate transporter
MLAVIETIAPIFLMIVIGFGFRRWGFPGEGFWQPAEKLAYYVLLPALIVRNLATADLAAIQVGRLAVMIIITAVTMTLLGLALKPLYRGKGPAYTSVLQGVIRLNSYIGFGVAEAFYGQPGVVLSALFVAVMMPTVNVVSIFVLAAFAETGKPNWGKVPLEIIRNPIILACAAGGLLNAVHAPLPGWTVATLTIGAKAALPIALMCVGGGLVHAIGNVRFTHMAQSCALKLLVMPVVGYFVAGWLGLGGLTLTIAVMFAALPSSPAAYILARQLGGDAPLMAAILTAQTAVCAITLPLILLWLG